MRSEPRWESAVDCLRGGRWKVPARGTRSYERPPALAQNHLPVEQATAREGFPPIVENEPALRRALDVDRQFGSVVGVGWEHVRNAKSVALGRELIATQSSYRPIANREARQWRASRSAISAMT